MIVRKIKRVGGSLMVVIPPDFAEALDITANSSVSLHLDGQTLQIMKEIDPDEYSPPGTRASPRRTAGRKKKQR